MSGFVLLTDDFPPVHGGVAVWAASAARVLARVGHVHVYTRQREIPVMPMGVTLHGVAARSFARRGALALAWAARHRLHDHRVLCSTWSVGRWVSRFAAVDVVCHGSDRLGPHPTGGFHGTWSRATGRWAVSDHLARCMTQLGHPTVRLPLPLAPGRPVQRGRVWVFVGRCVAGKGGERFIRLCAAAGVEGRVVGDGPERCRWERIAQDLGASIVFTGWVRDVGPALEGAAAVFLLSDRTEGLGLSLIEARQRGVPVVGTPVGGIIEALGNGLLLGRREHAGDVSRVVDWLHSDPQPEPIDERDAFLRALV